MNKLTSIILVLFLSLLSLPSWSNEDPVIYECNFGNGIIGFYKVEKINNNPLISFRKNLQWLEWCSGKHRTLKMSDEGGICHIKYHKISENITMDDQTSTFDFLMKTIVSHSKNKTTTTKCKIAN